MAFVSKIRNMLKQTVSKHVNLELSTSNPSIFQAIRCMSSSKLFVGGLPYATDEMSLREAFAQYGVVVEAKVITDRETGRSRGFGFVTYTSSDEASIAIQSLDGKDFQGRWLKVNYAVEKPRPGGFNGGYGGNSSYDYHAGGGGGYRGSGSYGSPGSSYNSVDSGYGDGNSYFRGNAGGLATGDCTGTAEASFGAIIEDGNKDFRQEKMEENYGDDNNYANARN